MPANRSRTQEWRRCLKQIHERGGSLELAIAQDDHQGAQHLVWRVRLLDITADQVIVEQPSALGESIRIDPGIELIVVLSIGQNRWTFRTSNVGAMHVTSADRKPIAAMALSMPTAVQRCQRRQQPRFDTASLNLPLVEVWPLLDPKSVLVAERACALQESQPQKSTVADHAIDDELAMPEVGPKFTATLVNLGGGGVGLRVNHNDSQVLTRHKVFWLRLVLPGDLCLPICATGKLVHTHMESNHDTYAGLAFDFSFNQSHQKYVVDQINRYIAAQQKRQQFRPATTERLVAGQAL